MASDFLLDGAVEVRRDSIGRFDELVVGKPGECSVHFEMMDHNVLWIGLYPNGPDKDSVHVTISARGFLKIEAHEA